MKRRVRLTSAANRDLARLVEFMAKRSLRSALRAGDLIEARVRSLAEFSKRGRPGPDPGLRELVIRFGRGAYIVQYRVDPDAVVVARIFHSNEQR